MGICIHVIVTVNKQFYYLTTVYFKKNLYCKKGGFSFIPI
jgi:hypothetical protein